MSETATETLARSATLGSALKQTHAMVGLLKPEASGISKDSGILWLEIFKALAGRGTQANAAGNSTVTPGQLCLQHVEIITFSGAADTTRVVVLNNDNIPPRGGLCFVRCLMPATADITVEFRNEAADGTLLTSFLTDDSGDDKVAVFESDGTDWNFFRFDAYANA